ncbi:MAG: glycosyltransferase [Bacteroidetes bacterium]|nr:glycosyltransferase [Bacteroidota bacterium]
MKKRILFLADSGSAHTHKWALALAAQGIHIGIFSMRKNSNNWAEKTENITIYDQSAVPDGKFHGRLTGKLSYFSLIPALKKIIREFKPDIVHSHYASSYGLLGRKSGFHPLIISSWGSDVMDFPKRGKLARKILQKNFFYADLLLATSPTIVRSMEKFTDKKVYVIPFGVDTAVFCKEEKKNTDEKNRMVFGIVKSLEPVYNVSLAISAFSSIREKYPEKNLQLLIVGTGTERKMLEEKVKALRLSGSVTFAGKIDHDKIPEWMEQINVFINISKQESFGVSVLEAMACRIPVIVSETGGLAEIVDDGMDGLRVPVNDLGATVTAMEKLLADPNLRIRMGNAGRKKVKEKYEWKNNVDEMIRIYTTLI